MVHCGFQLLRAQADSRYSNIDSVYSAACSETGLDETFLAVREHPSRAAEPPREGASVPTRLKSGENRQKISLPELPGKCLYPVYVPGLPVRIFIINDLQFAGKITRHGITSQLLRPVCPDEAALSGAAPDTATIPPFSACLAPCHSITVGASESGTAGCYLHLSPEKLP